MTAIAIAIGFWVESVAAFLRIRWTHGASGSVSRYLSICIAAGLALMATLGVSTGYSFDSAAALLAYAFLSELFVFLFTLVDGSISVAMLLRAYRGQPLRADSESDLDRAVRSRLMNMTSAGLIVQVKNRFHLTERGESVLRIARRLRQFFCHRTSSEQI